MTSTSPPSPTQAVVPGSAQVNAPVPEQGAGAGPLKTPVTAFLEASKPIAFNINFARITGDAKAALFLSQLVYWTRRGTDVLDNDGWVFKSREQWEAEIGLSKHEQVTVRNTLVHLGLIEEARTGAPARNCYRVVPGVLGAHLAQLVRSEPVQWSLLDIRSDTQHIRSMLGRNFAFYRVLMGITSTCTSAIYLSKALAIQRRFVDRQPLANKDKVQTAQLPWDTDWFRMAVDSTQDETGLSASQQRDAKHKLCQLGLLHEALMTHPRKQIYLRIDMKMLNQLLVHATQNPFNPAAGQNRATDKHRDMSASDDCVNSAKWLSLSHLAILPQPIPEDPVIGPSSDPPELSDPAACQNRATRMTDSDKLDVRFPQGRWPVLARPMSGFDVLSCPVLTGLHAHASRVRQDYKEDYIETTTTTEAPAKVELVPTKPDISPPNSRNMPVALQARPVGSTTDEVVVVPLLKKPEAEQRTQSSSWIWPDALTKVEQEQGARILNSLAKTGQLDDAQIILDELAGCLARGGVKSNLSYLRRLVETHQTTPGGLVFERAQDVRIRRERLEALAQRSKSDQVNQGEVPRKTDSATTSVPVERTEAAKAGLAKAREMLAALKHTKGSS
ncbi:hypothetical protein QLQ16_06670 [Limnohabitans sp. HM2-2]|uniref:Replication protein 15 n=1 Tax=Limnohabitans lacus TaxID=3045173 RepID=A0ABT6X5V7_9BURK|nr:hypothetical protein [Limnohabitans sp. HM2-2]